MTVWVVRHGESTSNAGAPTKTPGEAPLTELGRRQAYLLGLQFGEAQIHRVVTSSYVRAQETGHILSLVWRPQGGVYEWEDIQEWNLLEPSNYVGTTHDERLAAVDRVIQQFDPDYVDGPGAESFHTLLNRVEAFVAKCRQLPSDETTVVVSHGWFIKALLWTFAVPSYRSLSSVGVKAYWQFAKAFEIDNCQRFQLTFLDPPRRVQARPRREPIRVGAAPKVRK